MKIKIDVPKIKEAISLLDKTGKVVPRATAAALNRAIDSARTEAVRGMRETYTAKYGGLRKEIKVKRASSSRLESEAGNKGHNLPLLQFRTSPTKPPRRQPSSLTAMVRKGGKKPIPGAFVANLGKYGPGVFRRTGPQRRAPAEQLYGPGVPIMLGEKGITARVMNKAHDTMGKRLDHELRRALGRLIVT